MAIALDIDLVKLDECEKPDSKEDNSEAEDEEKMREFDEISDKLSQSKKRDLAKIGLTPACRIFVLSGYKHFFRVGVDRRVTSFRGEIWPNYLVDS